jgi:glycosyltransferase involved in cell wall biosynthesis
MSLLINSGFPGGFTVLMAVYAKDDVLLFEKAVMSVFKNDLQPDAFVLVVDGPVPDLLSHLIESLKVRCGISVLYLKKNVGLAAALNAGLELVCTEWLVRADADDLNVDNRFKLQADFLKKEGDIDIFGGAIQEVDRSGTLLAVRRTVETHEQILSYACKRNPFNHMTVACRTEFVKLCGGYPNIYLKEDYALWASMLAAGARSANMPNILVRATTGRDMYRRRGGFRYAMAEIALQKHLVNIRLKPKYMAILHGLGRSAIFIMPSAIRGLIYEKILRQAK